MRARPRQMRLTHDRRSKRHDEEDDGPQEETDPGPHIRRICVADDADHAYRHDGHADSTVNLPFWEVEEEELAATEEQDGAGEVIEGDHAAPGDRTCAQGEDEEAVVAPHADGCLELAF